MTTTGLDILDDAVGEANRWVQEIMEELGETNRHLAYAALRSVLHSIRDCLPFEDAMRLAGQLPPVVRGFYLEGWKPDETPRKEWSRPEFLTSVAERILALPHLGSDQAIRAVFGLLSRRMDRGAMVDFRDNWPEPLRGFWPRVATRAPFPSVPSETHQRALVDRTISEIEALIESARRQGVPEESLPVLLPPGRSARRPPVAPDQKEPNP